MNPVEECYEITKLLTIVVQNALNEEEREIIIDEIDELLFKREELLPKITPPFTLEESKKGEEIIKWNYFIDNNLAKIRTKIQNKLNKANKTKESVQKYVNPYQSLQTDGSFYDKRK
ncbi:MAG TPA: hypothetical protein VEV44_16810 [Pseudoneobacillus sp.]|nr:hypothetical protein [Pseudoneobacillus sp.]